MKTNREERRTAMTYTEMVETMQNGEAIPVSVLYDETQHTEEGGNVCEGCRYYQACGYVFRSEPCEGFAEELTEEEQEAEEKTEALALIERAKQELEGLRLRSAWDRGVNVYAFELLADLAEAVGGGWVELWQLQSRDQKEKAMLNGADDWNQYSWGGSSLIYDADIAERLCTPSELRRTKGGQNRPNSSEDWLDVQTRALTQAAGRASKALKKAQEIN